MSTGIQETIPVSIPASPALDTGITSEEPGKDAGISFREAALRLSMSEKTLRARIRGGEIHAWTVEGKRGLEWRVQIPEGQDGDRDTSSEARGESRDPGSGSEVELAVAQARAERLADEVAWLRGRLEESAQETRELRILLARALPPPMAVPALETNVTPPVAAPDPPIRVKWWQLWRRGGSSSP